MKRLAKTIKSRYRGIAPMLLPTRTTTIKAYQCACSCSCPNGESFVASYASGSNAEADCESKGNC